MSKNIINEEKGENQKTPKTPKNLKKYLMKTKNKYIMDGLKEQFNLNIDDAILKMKINKNDKRHFKLMVIKLMVYLCYKEIEDNYNKMKLTLLIWYLEDNNFKYDYKIIYNNNLDIDIVNLRNLYNFIMKDENLFLEIDKKEYKEIKKFNCCCCLEDKEEFNKIYCSNCKPNICCECFINIENRKCPICRGNLKINNDKRKITFDDKEGNIRINKNELFTLVYYEVKEDSKFITVMDEIKILSFTEIMSEQLEAIKERIPEFTSDFIYNMLDFKIVDKIDKETLSDLLLMASENPKRINPILNLLGLNNTAKLGEIFISLIDSEGVQFLEDAGFYNCIKRITKEDCQDTEFYFITNNEINSEDFEEDEDRRELIIEDNNDYLTILLN